MIEKDPTLPEAELLEVLKNVNPKFWTAVDNQKLLEAVETWGQDDSAISLHVGTKSIEQVHTKLQSLSLDMKNKPELAMSDIVHTDSKTRKCIWWTESEK